LDDLKNNAVRKDAEYAIQATRPSWVYLTRHDDMQRKENRSDLILNNINA
jgi:hypothetical protein